MKVDACGVLLGACDNILGISKLVLRGANVGLGGIEVGVGTTVAMLSNSNVILAPKPSLFVVAVARAFDEGDGDELTTLLWRRGVDEDARDIEVFVWKIGIVRADDVGTRRAELVREVMPACRPPALPPRLLLLLLTMPQVPVSMRIVETYCAVVSVDDRKSVKRIKYRVVMVRESGGLNLWEDLVTISRSIETLKAQIQREVRTESNNQTPRMSSKNKIDNSKKVSSENGNARPETKR